jgi:hypothetical protein
MSVKTSPRRSADRMRRALAPIMLPADLAWCPAHRHYEAGTCTRREVTR